MKSLHSHLSVLLLVLVVSYQSNASIVYVNQAATGNKNGASWANAYTSLELAITAALSGDQIWVASGTYKPGDGYDRTASFQLKKGVRIYGGFTGSETLSAARNYANNPTILSGEVGIKNYTDDNSYHVIFHPSGLGLDTTAVLDGFTIRGGCANGNGHQHSGGGIYTDNNVFKIKNCKIIENSANNADAKATGGGIYLSSSNISIENCQISNNSCAWDGGGMYIVNSSPSITNCLITKNTSVYGGGIYFRYSGNAVFTNVTIANNSVSNSGGGLFAYDGGSGTFNNCIFWGNEKSGTSNEIYLYGGSTISLNYSCYANSVYNAGNFTTTNCIDNDPLFADNYLLSSGSPCLNRGNDASNTTAYDIAGHARKIFTIDLGAYESDYCSQNCTVNNNADNGTGTLRWAMDNICDGGSITFATDMTINLSTELVIGLKSLNMDGTGKNITISGNHVCRVLHITGVTGKIYNLTKLTITNANTFDNGGGLLGNTDNGGILNVTNCVFSGSSAYRGAGAYADKGCTFTNCSFSGNSAVWSGGGVFCSEGGILNNCSFTGNQADYGGGATADSGGSFINCDFSSNTATSNGGGAVTWERGDFTNCTFRKNTSASEGGGVSTKYGGNFTNCTFSGNSASLGGGARAFLGGSFTNCVFWNSTSSEISVEKTGMNFTYCAVKGGYTGQGAGTGMVLLKSIPFKSETDLTLNAIFDGGVLCIGSGNNDANQTSFDVAGNARKKGTIDLGAYESPCFGNAYTVVSSANEGAGSLRWTIDNICEGGIITFATDMKITLSSELVINSKSLTIDGTGKKITISGNKVCRVFNISTPSKLVSLTIADGSSDYGGGILACVSPGQLYVTNCFFLGNTASREGGGAFAQQSCIITNCTFSDNYAGSGSEAVAGSSSNFINCIFWNKNSFNSYNPFITGAGGFTYCAVKGGHTGTGNINLLESPFISETDLSLNTTGGGGDLCINSGNNAANSSTKDVAGNPRKIGTIDMGAYESSYTCLSNIMITSNSYEGGTNLQVAIDNICDGGTITFAPGLKIMLAKEITIGPKSVHINGTGKNITISGNDGCRVFNIQGVNGKAYTIEGLTISNGFTSDGSGLTADLSNGHLNVTNCVFNHNQATANGGAVKTKGGNFTNCTFSANYAVNQGSGVYASGGSIFTNCLFYNLGNKEIYVEGSGPSITYCAVKGGYTGTGAGAGMVILSKSQSPFKSETDLSLDTSTESGYSCFNAGNDDANTTSLDIAGNERKIGTIDIGAYEALCVNGLMVKTNANDGIGSLRWVIQYSCEGASITFTPGLNIVLATEIALGSKSLTIDGTGNNVTISGNNVCRVFNITGVPGKTCELKGLTIANARTTGTGGGLLGNMEKGGALNVTNCIFIGNTAGQGGGAYAGSGGTFTNCTFTGNHVTSDGNSGAVYCFRGGTLINCLFWTNSGSEISTEGTGMRVNYCAIKGGYTGEGAGIGIVSLTSSPFVSGTNLSLNVLSDNGFLCMNTGNNNANNSASDLAGNPRKTGTIDIGAYESITTICKNDLKVTNNAPDGVGSLKWVVENICEDKMVTFASDMTITLSETIVLGSKSITIDGTGKNITISGNNSTRVFHIFGVSGKIYNLTGLNIVDGYAPEKLLSDLYWPWGGGLYGVLNNGGILNITNCSFSGNHSMYGGGANVSGQSTFTNCVFSKNIAHDQGGGVYASGGTFINCTFSMNNAQVAGGAYAEGNGLFTNCIFWNTSNSESYNKGQSQINPGSNVNITHCAFKYGFNGTGNVTLTEMPFVDIDLNLGLNTHAGGGLLCIDAGLNSANNLATDIRGEARIQNSIIDMGAYEWMKLPGAVNPFPDNHWTGTTGTNWNTGSNWSLSTVPDNSNNAVITDAANDPVINSPATCKNLIIRAGGILDIHPGGTLIVNSTIINENNTKGLIIRSGPEGSGNLVNNTPGVGSTIEQYFLHDQWYQYTLPVTGQRDVSENFGSFDLTSLKESKFTGVEADIDSWDHLVTGYSLSAGIGYRAKYNRDMSNLPISIQGELFTGELQISTNYSGTANGWNLFGNPYPCLVDWQIVKDSMQNIEDALYVWNPLVGSYSSWVGGIGNPSTQTQYLKPMQGFMVRANAPNGSVTFSNKAKTTTALVLDETILQSIIRLAVTDPEGRKDESVIRMNAEATDHFDRHLDALKLKANSLTPQLYSVYYGNNYSINSISEVSDHTVIPLEVMVQSAGKHAINLTEHSGNNGGYNIYLENLSTGDKVKLLTNEKYNFNADKAETMKFNLLFAIKTGASSLNLWPIKVYDRNMNIVIKGMGEKGNKVMVSNIIGQVVYHGTIHDSMGEIPVNRKGVYIVNVIPENGNIFNGKVVVK